MAEDSDGLRPREGCDGTFPRYAERPGGNGVRPASRLGGPKGELTVWEAAQDGEDWSERGEILVAGQSG